MAIDAFAAAGWLATYALHSTLLLSAAWLVARWVRSEPAREWIWKCALVGGLFTATWQASSTLQPFGGRWFLLESASSARPIPHQGVRPVLRAGADLPALDAGLAHAAARPISLRGALLAALALWGAGALARIFWLVWSLLRWKRRLGHRRELTQGPTFNCLERLLRRAATGARVRLFVAPDLLAPAAFGALRSSIALPERALNLPGSEQEAILAHELAHALRRDPLWHLLAGLVEAAFFFQPLNRLARAQLHELAEFQCDDWAMALTRSRLPLARSLTEVADWIVEREEPGFAAGMSARGSALARRVERILESGRQPKTSRLGLKSALLGVFLLSTAASAVPALSLQPDARTPEEPPLEPAPAGDLATALRALDGELQELRRELGRTRLEIEEALLPAPFLARMQQLEQRSLELEGLRAQLDDMVAARSASSSQTLNSQGD